MPVSPQYVGARYQPFLVTWKNIGDLTGATLTCRMRSKTDPGVVRAGDGVVMQTWGSTTVLRSQGQFFYQLGVGDVSVADNWDAQFKADFGGGLVAYHNAFSFEVQPPI